MNLQVSSDNMDVLESMQIMVENKVQRLLRLWGSYEDTDKYVRVVLNSGPDQTFIVKLEAVVKGSSYYGSASGASLEPAIVEAVEEVTRQYKKANRLKSSDWADKRRHKVLSEDDLVGEKD